MADSWTFTKGQIFLMYCSAILLGACITMIVMSILTSANTLIGTIIYTLIAVLTLMVTFGMLRQSRGALKQRYEIRRRIAGNAL